MVYFVTLGLCSYGLKRHSLSLFLWATICYLFVNSGIKHASSLQVSVTTPKRLFTNTGRSSRSHYASVNIDDTTIPTEPKNNYKYPTVRGSTVDSRKIIAEGAGKKHLQAVRLAHILLLSEDMAKLALSHLREEDIMFEDLARKMSYCSKTKEHGGNLGWVSCSEDGGSNEHLDETIPLSAREQVLGTTTKPGDVIKVKSSIGYHLVQIVDVMVDLRKMSNKKPRSRRKSTNVDRNEKIGILRGALSDQKNYDGVEEADKSPLYYKIETMGCQMNIADSERIEGQMQNLGIQPLPDDKSSDLKPDVVVLNTCSIRDHAEQKVYSYIGPYAKRKRQGEDVAIVVAGCVAQQEGEALLRRIPEIDLVMGPQYANRIGDLLEDVSNGNQIVATEASHIMEDSTKPRRSSTVAAWVNVIYGCNERCTYCIVPTTRGVEQSRPIESILAEVEDLISQGYKEVTLLGQNIDAYGRDMRPKRKFSDLLRTVGSVDGLKRLRFVTSHPRYMSLDVVDAVADTPAACESFHVPFQSGSNEILHAMGRGHTREKYFSIIDRIRARLPDASITADVIVGFPGETEAQFLDTLSLMEKVKFDSVNTASYSPRPNTPAALWTNQVSEEVKQGRLKRINDLNLKHASERRKRMMGTTVEVLVEERNIKKPSEVMGRTTHGYIVYCGGDIDALRGKLVMVKIEKCETYYLAGKMVEVVED